MPAHPIDIQTLKSEYKHLYEQVVIRSKVKPEAKALAGSICVNKRRYDAIAKQCKVPYYFIACIHFWECGGNWRQHLHNGDLLTAQTRNEPKGRPTYYQQTYTFEESAYDALVTLKGFNNSYDQSFFSWLWRLEKWKGFRCRAAAPGLMEPLLWNGTFYFDGNEFKDYPEIIPEPIKNRTKPGAIAILKSLEEDFGHDLRT